MSNKRLNIISISSLFSSSTKLQIISSEIHTPLVHELFLFSLRCNLLGISQPTLSSLILTCYFSTPLPNYFADIRARRNRTCHFGTKLFFSFATSFHRLPHPLLSLAHRVPPTLVITLESLVVH